MGPFEAVRLFVVKLAAVDALATRPVEVGDISALCHEPRDDTMEGHLLVVHIAAARADGLALAQFGEVLARPWALLLVELEEDAPRLAIVLDLDVEPALERQIVLLGLAFAAARSLW